MSNFLVSAEVLVMSLLTITWQFNNQRVTQM